jgi:hypothetical protein
MFSRITANKLEGFRGKEETNEGQIRNMKDNRKGELEHIYRAQ